MRSERIWSPGGENGQAVHVSTSREIWIWWHGSFSGISDHPLLFVVQDYFGNPILTSHHGHQSTFHLHIFHFLFLFSGRGRDLGEEAYSGERCEITSCNSGRVNLSGNTVQMACLAFAVTNSKYNKSAQVHFLEPSSDA